MRPKDCIVLTGEGARSTLHRDPFEWTGTSLCLEGSKVWTFLIPPDDEAGGLAALDKSLGSYRLQSVAWSGAETSGESGGAQGKDSTPDDNRYALSAGWQSNLDLYALRDQAVPPARELAELVAGSTERSEALMAATRGLKPSPKIPDSVVAGRVVGIQEAGDLLLVPRGWWHETYALEPAIAVASQYCGDHDAKAVFGHILDVAGARDNAPEAILDPAVALRGAATRSGLVGELFAHLRQARGRVS